VNDDDDRTGHFAALDGGFRRGIDLREFGAIDLRRTGNWYGAKSERQSENGAMCHLRFRGLARRGAGGANISVRASRSR
jgi:hypothetical protein